MSDGSTIEWLDRPGTKPATWNPIIAYREVLQRDGTMKRLRGWHCEHVHEGCRFCYAETINRDRFGTCLPYAAQSRGLVEIVLDENTLLQPLKWKHPRTIFVCSMTDLYGAWVTDAMLDKIKAVQALTPQHTYIELTKRPERMREYATRLHDESAEDTCRRLVAAWPSDGGMRSWARAAIPKDGIEIPLPNVWGLVSCSTQEDADKFIPILLNTPLAIRGVSAEPLLGPIDFENLPSVSGIGRYLDSLREVPFSDLPAKLDWVIIGGESGRNARPMHPDWARAIVSQCEGAGVACFFKQWGEWAPSTEEHAHGNPRSGWQTIKQHPHVAKAHELTLEAGAAFIEHMGKKAAGRLLDGREHNGFPQARTT